MEFSYRFTEKANADLDEIVRYIAVELTNPKAASDFADTLHNVINEICTFPESGTIVSNEFVPNPGIRKIPVNNYVVFYFTDFSKKTVFIVRIIYGRRNMDDIL